MVNDEKVLQMHEELIACDLIDLLPVDKTVRSFNKEFAKNLSVSLREEGLYNPIAVRPTKRSRGGTFSCRVVIGSMRGSASSKRR